MIQALIRISAGVMLAAVSTAVTAQEKFEDNQFRVANIQARLLYEKTGTLSEDVSDNPNFSLHNTIIGEGSAKENANDMLITAVIAGPGEHNATLPLVIEIKNDQGKLLAKKEFKQMLLGASTFRSMVIYDVGCAGVLSMTATFGASVRTEEIILACGE